MHLKMLEILIDLPLWTFLLSIVTLLIIARFVRDSQKRPPGPIGYPIIGNLLLMSSGDQATVYRKLRKKYGDVFSLRLGNCTIVVINGYESLREAFVKNGDVFSERADDYVFKHVVTEEKGIVGSSGEFWKQTRTFSSSILREFGFGKRSLESKVLAEVEAFLKFVERKEGNPFSVNAIAQISVANVICNIVFGKRFEHDEDDFKHLGHLLDENFVIIGKTFLANFFPILRYLPWDICHINELANNINRIFQYFKEQISHHRATYDEDDIRDFIDAFLKEQAAVKKSTEAHIVEDDNLIHVLLDLFIGGTDTTTTVIKWGILFLVCYPDVQEKVRQEICDVVGSSRLPSIGDKPKMPYTDAFIHETMRVGNILPTSLLHGVKHDTTFKGYVITTNDMVVPNLASLMFDDCLFKDPHTFNPARFIGEGGTLNGQERNVLAFSLGRRACPGENLARMEIFLFLTSIIQRFNILPEDDRNLPKLEPVTSFFNSPHDFKIKAVGLR